MSKNCAPFLLRVASRARRSAAFVRFFAACRATPHASGTHLCNSNPSPTLRMDAQMERTPLMAATAPTSASERFLQRIKSRRYDAFHRVTKRYKNAEKQQEGIDDVLHDIENSERLNSTMFMGSMLAILAHVAVGIVVMRWLEGWSVFDAAYFCVVTTTTVGYGDITPTRNASKLFVIYYVFVSIAIISTLLAFVVGTLIDRQEELLLRAIGSDGDDSDEEEQQAASATTGALDKSDIHEAVVSALWLFAILSVGVVVFSKLEKLSLLNAMYVTVISASTVGFGDLQPTRNSSKLIMTVWLCFATIYAAKVVAEVAGLFAKLKQNSATRRLMSATMDVKTLMRMDVDNDRRVDKAEFLAQMLIRTGKVSEEDVKPVLRRFDELDKDDSGYITMAEVQQQ
eukprot:TRINITY_DN126_c0_g1_i1.p1 TRINITY_DN126_c0_g1~~TRINITY_DN126_c0_g1_i1.p1  ORF type:complete len:399 (-),score=94.24 TRINITY_DN126_c0_g1_i1:648-1844(-)